MFYNSYPKHVLIKFCLTAEKFYEKFSRYQESYRQEDLEKLHILKRKEHLHSNNEYLNLFRYVCFYNPLQRSDNAD